MMRTVGLRALWGLMIVGCSSQPFCDFHDQAPIIALPLPDDYSGGDGLGSSMLSARYEEDGTQRDILVVTAGPGSQTEGIQLGRDGDLAIERSRPLSGICEREEIEDSESTCFGRAPGVALAFVSSWQSGSACLALGMAGDDRGGGVGFWCAMGTDHLQGEQFLLPLDSEEERLTSLAMVEPTERLVLGTNRGTYVYQGDGTTAHVTRVTWSQEGLPPADGPVAALSALAAAVPSGALVALAYAEQGQILVGELGPADGVADEVPFLPRWCVQGDTPGFGTVTKLAHLAQDGQVYLLVSAGGLVPEREPVVRIFALDLGQPVDSVQCAPHPPWETLACGEFEGVDLDCPEEDSDFGAALDVGNIDDTPEYEVIVGSPGVTVDGAGRAGAGFVFRPAREGNELLEVLVDSGEKRDNNRLGAGVVIAPIGDRAEPVLAAPGERSVLLFLCSGVGDAPPRWDSPMGLNNSVEDQRCRNPDR